MQARLVAGNIVCNRNSIKTTPSEIFNYCDRLQNVRMLLAFPGRLLDSLVCTSVFKVVKSGGSCWESLFLFLFHLPSSWHVYIAMIPRWLSQGVFHPVYTTKQLNGCYTVTPLFTWGHSFSITMFLHPHRSLHDKPCSSVYIFHWHRNEILLKPLIMSEIADALFSPHFTCNWLLDYTNTSEVDEKFRIASPGQLLHEQTSNAIS